MEPRRRPRGARYREGRSNFGDSSQIRQSKPNFTAVRDIGPEDRGLNVKLKMVSTINERKKEVLMGDNTGCVIVIVNSDSVYARLSEGVPVIVRNGFVEMKEDTYIRMVTNEWGKIEISNEDFNFNVKKENNISEVEYTLE